MLTLVKNLFKKEKKAELRVGKTKVRIKKEANGEPTAHELKQTIKVLNGSFGRLDRNH